MDAIRNVLEIICDLANAHLQNLYGRPDEWVTLTSLVDHGGSVNEAARNKIVMSLYNLTREASVSSYQATLPPSGSGTSADGLAVVSPPLYLNAHVMFMANFTEASYADGLAALSRLIGCFQQTPWITADSVPELPPEISKLTLDFENLVPVDVNYVMGMLGTRYLPSAFYKVRLIPFASSAMQSRAYAVSGTGTGESSTR